MAVNINDMARDRIKQRIKLITIRISSARKKLALTLLLLSKAKTMAMIQPTKGIEPTKSQPKNFPTEGTDCSRSRFL